MIRGSAARLAGDRQNDFSGRAEKAALSKPSPIFKNGERASATGEGEADTFLCANTDAKRAPVIERRNLLSWELKDEPER